MLAPEPDAGVAPVMPPVIVPTVQAYVLGITDVSVIFVLEPLHMLNAVFEIIGACETVIVLVLVNGTQVPAPSGSFDVNVNVTVPL